MILTNDKPNDLTLANYCLSRAMLDLEKAKLFKDPIAILQNHRIINQVKKEIQTLNKENENE